MRVVVVGAGLAGLTAACDLVAAGIDTTVLEARDRVGGRTLGIEVAPGSWVDAGAAYLGDRHTELHAMLAEVGLKTTPTGMIGASVFALGSRNDTRDGRFPPLSAVGLGEMFELLERLTTEVHVDAPWLTPDAASWDSLTAAQWAEQNLRHPDARLFFPLFLGEMMAAAPARISALHMAFYLRSGGGTGYLNAFEGGAQQDRIDGGAHGLCEHLAARLGGRVRLGRPVTAIHQDGHGAIVYTATGAAGGGAHPCDAVVVAIPPLLADAIEYRPGLPVRRAGENTVPGCAIKVHLVYPAPLWRDHGLSGWSVSSSGPLLSTVDDSPAGGGVGVLTGFVTGLEAQRFGGLAVEAQRAQALDQAARLFPQLPPPIDFHVTDWVNDEYSRGCYAALFGPGDWVRRGPYLTTTHHRVHWAGTETSTEYFGLMEGAIRSGHRVARELLTVFGSQASPKLVRPRPQGDIAMSTTSVAPLSVRQQFMTEPGLGAGNFLDYAARMNPNSTVPFAYSHTTDHRGGVVLRGYSLLDLVDVRDRYAKWYWANGVRPGEPVGIVVADGLEPLLHYLALNALGAIPALVNDAMRTDVMIRYLDYVGVVGIVADDTTWLASAYRADPSRRPRFLALTAEVQAFDADSAQLPPEYPYTHSPDDVCALIHSSGTTGTPKSTMLGHRSFWDGKQPRMVRFPAEPYDKLMSLMPHTHAGGLSYFLTATLLGLPTVVMADWRRVVVEPVMEAFQPTMLASFPRTFVELATGDLPVKGAARVHSWFNTADSAHYGHIRRLVQLGERPAGLIKAWLLPTDQPEDEALPGSQFVDGLGSSEMGMALFGGLWTAETPRNDRCIGKAQESCTKAAVLDDDGNEVPDGTVGLLAVITPSRTPGYWNNPRLTSSFELNGYWLTGDVARRDAEGNYYHLDRTVDVIDTASGPVYSLPIEEVLIADCADVVVDCAVVGVPGPPGQSQWPIAVVQLQAGAEDWTADAILEKANKELSAAGLASLAAVIIASTPSDYPLGPTGKVLKRELRTKLARLFADGPSVADEHH